LGLVAELHFGEFIAEENEQIFGEFIARNEQIFVEFIAESDLSDSVGCKPDVMLNKLPSLKGTNSDISFSAIHQNKIQRYLVIKRVITILKM